MTHAERTLLLAASITPLRSAAKPSPEAERLLDLDYLADAWLTDAWLTVTAKGRAALAATRGQALLSPESHSPICNGIDCAPSCRPIR